MKEPVRGLIPGMYNGDKVWVTTDIVSAQEIANRVRRHKSTIVGHWVHREDFPRPVLRLGHSRGWYWPDIQAWCRKHQLGG